MAFHVPRKVLSLTFDHLRMCGRGRCECQVLWTSSWSAISKITDVVHPKHRAHVGGFEVESGWLTAFWLDLAEKEQGIRVQVHTHPGEAFHSHVDDAYPMIHTPGFLSLVIPEFAKGDVGFEDAFLAQLGEDGRFREVPICQHLKVVE